MTFELTSDSITFSCAYWKQPTFTSVANGLFPKCINTILPGQDVSVWIYSHQKREKYSTAPSALQKNAFTVLCRLKKVYLFLIPSGSMYYTCTFVFYRFLRYVPEPVLTMKALTIDPSIACNSSSIVPTGHWSVMTRWP